MYSTCCVSEGSPLGLNKLRRFFFENIWVIRVFIINYFLTKSRDYFQSWTIQVNPLVPSNFPNCCFKVIYHDGTGPDKS